MLMDHCDFHHWHVQCSRLVMHDYHHPWNKQVSSWMDGSEKNLQIL